SASERSEHPAVLVAHGGEIAALTATLLELPVEHYAVLTGLGNTCWVQLSAHPRPAPDTGADDRTAALPTAPGARNVLWRLDQWNAGITPPVEAPGRYCRPPPPPRACARSGSASSGSRWWTSIS